jgi:hypothetical protein
MSFVAVRGLAALLAAVALPVLSQSASAADLKRSAAPAMVTPAPVPTGSELVGKLLSEQNGPSDPDVPMPQRGLTRTQDLGASAPLAGPQIYGRQEDGGAVFGLKFPIPATRGAN